MNTENEPVSFVGPFESCDVTVEGRVVPFLIARADDRGNVQLTLDRRFGLDLTLVEAQRIIPFIADCIAVAMGYASFPREGREPVRMTPFPHLHMIAPSGGNDEPGHQGGTG